MKKIFFAFILGMGFFAFASVGYARAQIVIGGFGGYPGYYGYGPVIGYPSPYPPAYVPAPYYQPYYGYYPYGPIPVATGAPFIYSNQRK